MAQLSSSRTYEWQITSWWANVGDRTPQWPQEWERGTLRQLREQLQPYIRDTAEYAVRVRDPKSGESLPMDAIRDYWLEQEIPS